MNKFVFRTLEQIQEEANLRANRRELRQENKRLFFVFPSFFLEQLEGGFL